MSTYHDKHYREIEFCCREEQCPHCDKIFYADTDQCRHITKEDQARSFAVVFCPYCGRKTEVCQ